MFCSFSSSSLFAPCPAVAARSVSATPRPRSLWVGVQLWEASAPTPLIIEQLFMSFPRLSRSLKVRLHGVFGLEKWTADSPSRENHPKNGGFSAAPVLIVISGKQEKAWNTGDSPRIRE